MLSTTTGHALRALVHMARLPEGGPILGRDLAKRARVPANYLSKILWALRNAGYVETLRGQRGGYRLSRASHLIKLIDIAELFEGNRIRPGCLIGEKYDCTESSFCSAHAQWKEVKRSYSMFLESNTIADIVYLSRFGKERPWLGCEQEIRDAEVHRGRGSPALGAA